MLRPYSRVLAALALAIPAALTGCQSGGQSADAGVSSSAPYAQAYSSGQYQTAYTQAAAAASGGDEHAALIAGMSASAMGKQGDAARWLTPLTRSEDPGISGRACWTLGSMAESQGRHAVAADWYRQAAEALSGDDAARAALSAGDAYRRANDPQADSAYALGMHKAQSDSLKATLESRRGSQDEAASATAATLARAGQAGNAAMLSSKGASSGSFCTTIKAVSGTSGQTSVRSVNVLGGGPAAPATSASGPFTIQLAAFADQARAAQHVKSAKAAAQKAGIPSPQVVPVTDATGRTLYAVRLGSYVSRTEASQQLSRLGLTGIVVSAR